MHLHIVPFVRDDGHRTTAQQLADSLARDAEDRKPDPANAVASYSISKASTVTFVDPTGRTYSYGPQSESSANLSHVWKPSFPF